MKLSSRIERALAPYAIVHLAIYLVVFQSLTFFLALSKPDYIAKLVLTNDGLMRGEWWRLITMAVMPPSLNPLFAIMSLYFFVLMGTALENQWGEVRFNLYLLIGYICTMAVGFVPNAHVGNGFWLGSVLLAFAWLYPDFVILLFFVFPCKMKWIGLVAWLSYLAILATGSWSQRAQVAAGTANFLVFFHRDLFQWAYTSRRKFKSGIVRANERAAAELPMHVCTVCGVDEKSNPKMEFRYCPQCAGTPCYCIDHIQNHTHR